MAADRSPLLPLAALLALPCLAWGQGIPPGYYDTVDPTDATTLRATLHPVIDDHTRYPYTGGPTDTWDILNDADEDPTNPSRIVDVYKNAPYFKFSSSYNREHTWPKSYGFPDDGPTNYPYTDCHTLRLCDAGYNTARSNKPFRYCSATCTEYTTQLHDGMGGGSGTYPGNSNWTAGSFTQGTWEVWSGRRGDVARSILYMDIRYEGGLHSITGIAEPDLIVTDSVALINQSNTGQNESVAYMGILADLLQWHIEDPVDQRERDRNDVVYSYQGNRNPFVDHPEWVSILHGGPPSGGDPVVWINEFHYDNAGADVGEFVEVAGPAGENLNGYSLVGYNGGAAGFSYQTINLSGTIPDQGGCVGTLSFAFPGLQDGPIDGIALVDPSNNVQFLSYEGSFTAANGPAQGLTSIDVGVEETGSTPIGDSLQAIGTGTAPDDFTWTGPQAESPGGSNSGQTFDGACPTVTLYGCGTNPPGSLVWIGGLPEIGQTVSLGIDNPLGTQSAGSFSFLAISAAPDPAFPCGTPLPGWGMGGPFGEMLVVPSAPNLLALLSGPPWLSPGNPAPIDVSIPFNPAYLGVKLYVQGLLFDLIGGSVPYGLTEGAELAIGS